MLAKVGLDGHDRGMKVVARGLRDEGFHVIYGGIWQSPEAVARAAIDEDADWLGLSLLSGAHMTLVPRVLDSLAAGGNRRTRCLLGGIIPDDDVAKLKSLGVAAVFGPGTSIPSIVDFLRQPTEPLPDENVAALVAASRRGDRVGLARLLTLIDQGRVSTSDLVTDVAAKRIRATAITGSAGVGKSSLIAELVSRLIARDKRVAVLACDPQSPLTGGALLGDRVRMNSGNMNDDRMLIRSLAVPSGRQGIAEHLEQMIQTLDAYGFDLVLVESVGASQGDVAVKSVADKVVVLLQPESGDAVQWEKAGLLEVADLLVINKSDLPGADRLEAELKQHLNLPGYSHVPIIRASATKKSGLEELCEYVTQ